MLKFQSENTYRGKKGNSCWSIPESTIRKLMKQFYSTQDEQNATANLQIIDSNGKHKNKNGNCGQNNCNGNKNSGNCKSNPSQNKYDYLKSLRRTELSKLLETTALDKIQCLMSDQRRRRGRMHGDINNIDMQESMSDDQCNNHSHHQNGSLMSNPSRTQTNSARRVGQTKDQYQVE